MAGRNRAEPASRQWSIPSKLTLATVPIVVVALLLGVFLVWSLATSGDVWLAVTVGVVVGLVALGSLLVAYRMGRAIGTRIGSVTSAARRVAHKDLVDLLDALRTSDPGADAIPPLGLDIDSGDEIGDLSRSFENMHRALIDTSTRQMESLRVGVSGILVTLAGATARWSIDSWRCSTNSSPARRILRPLAGITRSTIWRHGCAGMPKASSCSPGPSHPVYGLSPRRSPMWFELR